MKALIVFVVLIAFMGLSGCIDETAIQSNNGLQFNGTLLYGLSELNLTDGLIYKYNKSFIIEHSENNPLSISTNLDMQNNEIINCANCELKFNATDLCKFNVTSQLCEGSRQFGLNYTMNRQTYVIVMLEVTGANKAIDLEFYENGQIMTDHDHTTGAIIADIDDDAHMIIPKGTTYNVTTNGTTATIETVRWYEQRWE